MANNLSLYYRYRQDIKPGDPLLWESEGFVGTQIQEITGHNVNHASLAVKVNDYDRDFQTEVLKEGVVLKAISQRLKEHEGKVWWLPLKDKFNEKRELINKTAFYYIGVDYDFPSLFKQTFMRVYPDDERLFCSEFDYFCWWKAGVEMFNPSGYAPRPGDIYDLKISDVPKPGIKIL